MSQREAAARAGVSPSTIARIERGRMEPTLDLLMRLVRGCGLDLRMRLEVADGSADSTNSLDFESRLLELKKLSEFVVETRANREN